MTRADAPGPRLQRFATLVLLTSFSIGQAAHAQPPTSPFHSVPTARPSRYPDPELSIGASTTHGLARNTTWNRRTRYGHADQRLHGATTEMRFRRRRFLVGTSFTYLAAPVVGATESFERYGVVHDRMTAYSFTITAGYSSPTFAIEAGISPARIQLDAGTKNASPIPAAGHVRIRMPFDGSEGRIQLGTRDGYLLDPTILSLGTVVPRGRVRFGFDVSIGASMLPDVASNESFDEGVVLGSNRRRVDFFARADLDVRLGRRTHLELSCLGGTQWPRVTLGLRIDVVDGRDTVGSRR